MFVVLLAPVVAHNIEHTNFEAFEGETFGELEDWVYVALAVRERHNYNMNFDVNFAA